MGYRFGAYEVLINTGLAYATERIGSTASPDSGQTKLTYDLDLSLRYDMNNQYCISVGDCIATDQEDLSVPIGAHVFEAPELGTSVILRQCGTAREKQPGNYCIPRDFNMAPAPC